MSDALILILALSTPHIHRTKDQCRGISYVLVKLTAYQVTENPKPPHWKPSQDLKAIRKFDKECNK